MTARLIYSPPRDPQPSNHRRALALLFAILLAIILLSACAGIIEPPARCVWQALDRCGTGPTLPALHFSPTTGGDVQL